jgi:hypothetical protein
MLAGLWKKLDKVTIVWTLVTAVAAVIGGAIGFYTQFALNEQRISRLELQMKSPSSGSNPMLEICAELARDAAKSGTVSRSYLIDLMARMNCDARR